MYQPKFHVVNPKDAIQSVHSRGQFHSLDELESMSAWIKPDGVVLDIGANVGNHTVYFSRCTEAKEIYVIEPVPVAYDILKINLELNQCVNVNTDHLGVALANEETQGYPVAYVDNLGSATLFEAAPTDSYYDERFQKFDPVPVVTGDSIFQNISVDFVKIDVEFMELKVLDGLRKTIRRCRPVIHIEVNRENMPGFLMWLTANRYSIELVDRVKYTNDVLQHIKRICEVDHYINFLIVPN